MRIGITGHQRLPDPAAWPWVEQEMNQFLGAAPKPLVGISSLAAGADQLFAKSVLQHGGTLEVVIPFAAYDATFVTDRDREEFKRLLRRCARSETLEKCGTDEQAYFAAGKRVIDLSDLVVAVWDGEPARGLGGTADAVKYGSQQRKIIVHLNPITKTRREITVGEYQL
jgi:hypothetical protein